jgi:hypothetical protein
MYEKPQYITPDGYRRSSKNPYKKKVVKKAVRKTPAGKNSQLSRKMLSVKQFQKDAQRGISKEAAKLIAQALKGMLKE